MKKLHGFLFRKAWGNIVLVQALFFSGLFLGSGQSGIALGILSGLVWFGSSVLWMLGKQNSWNA